MPRQRLTSKNKLQAIVDCFTWLEEAGYKIRSDVRYAYKDINNKPKPNAENIQKIRDRVGSLSTRGVQSAVNGVLITNLKEIGMMGYGKEKRQDNKISHDAVADSLQYAVTVIHFLRKINYPIIKSLEDELAKVEDPPLPDKHQLKKLLTAYNHKKRDLLTFSLERSVRAENILKKHIESQ